MGVLEGRLAASAMLVAAEESGYDSDTRKSGGGETVSPKSSDKSSDTDSSGETSGSFTTDTETGSGRGKDTSDTDSMEEPHYQVPKKVAEALKVEEKRAGKSPLRTWST